MVLTQTLTKPIVLADVPFLQEGTPLLTGEDLFAMGDIGPAELVQGKLIRLPFAEYTRGRIEANCGTILSNFVAQSQLGQVFGGDVGIYTRRNPDTVRAADVAYVSNARLAQIKSHSYLDVAPELIVEILSPDDRWNDVMDKLEKYFAIGVQLVWVADPKRQQIFAYSSPTEVKRFTLDDHLTGGDVLPGFQAALTEVFGA